MPRPFKCRRVDFVPEVTYFKPAGIPMKFLEEVRLTVEEAEALRLKDIQGLEQEEGAEKMNISRPTFQRVLAAARYKVADALLNGKAIRIGGGNFQLSHHKLHCANKHDWQVPSENMMETVEQLCPVCKAPGFEPRAAGRFGRGFGREGWLQNKESD